MRERRSPLFCTLTSIAADFYEAAIGVVIPNLEERDMTGYEFIQDFENGTHHFERDGVVCTKEEVRTAAKESNEGASWAMFEFAEMCEENRMYRMLAQD